MSNAETAELSESEYSSWTEDPRGPVALCLRQKLRSVEGSGDAVIFPPTYAGGKYNIDTFPDGKCVALIDSVGSQANRIEPQFKRGPLAALVPQVMIEVGKGEDREKVSLLDVGHRLGDALLRYSSADKEVAKAFDAYCRRGDCEPIARMAPTTLLFGAWDSRGGGAKVPRIFQATIRAWGVRSLTRSAQYNPPVNYAAHEIFEDQEVAEAEEVASAPNAKTKNPLAQLGFVHVPAVGKPGGIIADGGVYREVLINLVVVRALNAAEGRGPVLRRYILGLALAATTAEFDGNLRQGCLLVPDPSEPATWELVNRDGSRVAVALGADGVMRFAVAAAQQFSVGSGVEYTFNPKLAQDDKTKQKTENKAGKGKKKGSKKDIAASGAAESAPEEEEAEGASA